MRTSAFRLPATLTLPRQVRARHTIPIQVDFGLGPRNHQPRGGREYRIDPPQCLTNPRPQGGSLSLPPAFQPCLCAQRTDR